MIPLPPPTYEQVIEALAGCGVPSVNVRISYEDELQSDLVTISDLGCIAEDRLRCVRRAVHPFYVLQIENEAQRNAFYAFAERENRREAKAEAIEWLRAAGMLDRVPRYDPAQGIEIFARSVEIACGLPAGDALEAFDASILTFRREFLDEQPVGDRHDKFICLTRILAASDADEHGIHLGIVGNAAMTEDEL